jgi:hypothetical protein
MITEFSYHFRKLDVEDKPKKSKVPKTLKLINVKTQCLNDQLNKEEIMTMCKHDRKFLTDIKFGPSVYLLSD